jgi:hypothetical protein
MIPGTHDIQSQSKSRGNSRESACPDDAENTPSVRQSALDLAQELADRHQLGALSGLLASTRKAAGQDEITVAVVGRFKAGKSSFLNHFIGRDILPAGVVPLTAVITEIRFGAREEARVHHLDGSEPEVPLSQIGAYISEKENPENRKQAALTTPALRSTGCPTSAWRWWPSASIRPFPAATSTC